MIDRNEKPDLSWIANYRTDTPNFGLERMEAMLAYRGNPHKQLSVIHIAGTNGKGSTIATLRELLQLRGLRVGTFTSPYIVSYNEQIAINGQAISNQKLNQLLQIYKDLFVHQGHHSAFKGVTEFEIITALAYDYFAQEEVDVAIVEVGMGGLLDSTNVCQPDLTAISTIGLDHMALLGSTLGEIAEQKAGIIKTSIPIVTGKIDREALEVIQRVATSKLAPTYLYGQSYQVDWLGSEETGEVFSLENEWRDYSIYQTSLLGSYQTDNAALAIEICDLYCQQKGLPLLTKEEIDRGLLAVAWPARMEKILEQPLIFLDGAHNPHALSPLLASFQERFASKDKKILFTCIRTKALDEMLQLFAQADVSVTLTSFADERAVSEEEMKRQAFQTGLTYQPWQQYVDSYLQDAHKDQEVLLITGSLYFLAQVRAYILTKKEEIDGSVKN
ncbi:dihydrofolate synthetase [Streptococcus gordonii]|nr:dihydrofolate synthetase [Streptococcus gordonii]